MSYEVQQMFSRIAPRYDAANDLLSFGLHRLWRRRAVDFAGFARGALVLDLCCGTGDVSFCLAQRSGHRVVGLDFVGSMLNLARRKRASKRLDGQVSFLQADAMKLPFESGAFGGATVAFGIRNVDEPETCLREICRVLKPGAKLMVLEFGRPRMVGFSRLYQWYSRYLMPVIGGVVTGDRSAYEYLPRTSKEFPDGNEFVSLMRKAGFEAVRVRPLLSGVAFTYCGAARRSAWEPDELESRERCYG